MSYIRLLYHLIFRPRYSRPAITEAHEKLLYHYIWGIVKAKGGVLYRIGGMPDHLHLLVQLPPNLSLSGFMHDLKLSTHYFLREHREEFPLFEGWGKSYGALTCSARDKERVTAYIQNQKEHHRTTTLADELSGLWREKRMGSGGGTVPGRLTRSLRHARPCLGQRQQFGSVVIL